MKVLAPMKIPAHYRPRHSGDTATHPLVSRSRVLAALLLVAGVKARVLVAPCQPMPARPARARSTAGSRLTEAMEKQSLSKSRLAVMLKTSRSQVDRLLDPSRDVTLSTLQRAAALIGRKVHIQLV